MRVRGYAAYNPRRRNRALVENVQIILGELHDYLPLTLRQVFYRVVVKSQIDKTEHGYARLCEVCNRARRARMISFDDIRDDGPTIQMGHDFGCANELRTYLMDLFATARMDLQRFQNRRIWVWCEAAGMVPQLTKVAHQYGVAVISSGGFDSLTIKRDMADRLGFENSIVLHLGDYDPSGVHIFNSLAEDITALGTDAEFLRLAVTPEQIEAMQLPTTPPKKTDNRKFNDNRTVQCEAISPPELARILEDAIMSYTDSDRLKQARAWQQRIRNSEVQNYD